MISEFCFDFPEISDCFCFLDISGDFFVFTIWEGDVIGDGCFGDFDPLSNIIFINNIAHNERSWTTP